jgi:hypothetical protein
MSEGSRETKKAVMKTTNGGHFNLVPLKFDVLHHEMRNSELKIAMMIKVLLVKHTHKGPCRN